MILSIDVAKTLVIDLVRSRDWKGRNFSSRFTRSDCIPLRISDEIFVLYIKKFGLDASPLTNQFLINSLFGLLI